MRWLLSCIVAICLASASHAQPTGTQAAMLGMDCQNGDAAACERALFAGIGSAGAWTALVVLADALPDMTAKRREACEANDQTACRELASLLYFQNLDSPNESYRLFAAACDAGDAFSCVQLSLISAGYDYGGYENGAALYAQMTSLCADGDLSACASQSRLNAQLPDVPQDHAIWYGQTVDLCDADVARACTFLSYMLGSDGAPEFERLESGFDFWRTRNRRLSVRYAQKGCDLGNPVACWNLALSYDDGDGVRVDWKTAHEYSVKNCLMGDPAGCDEINYESYWNGDDPLEALQSACDTGDFTACFLAANKVHDPIGRNLHSGDDPTATARYLADMTDICEQGHLNSCVNAAIYERKAGRDVQAERLAHAACELGRMNGCFVLGNVYKLDREDHARAIYLYEIACEERVRNACNNLGDSFERGLGVPVDLDRARALFTKSCDLGAELGCRNLAELDGN